MNFMFSWQEQYLNRLLRSLARYWSRHSNVKFISSRHRVISSIYLFTSSNHRLESAGMNALEELLFKILGMGREDSNAYLACKRNSIRKDHFIESVTENWRYFPLSPISVVSPLRRVLSSIQAGRRGMFICSKLRQIL